MALATVPEAALEAALIKAVGLDRVPAEQRALALNIAQRYDLDLMLKHLVLIEGRPYITRDGLLHVAHRSGVFDGIEVTDPTEQDGYWHVRATVYRKDMTRGFAYPGRYPVKGKNATFGPEMATKVAEVMALRRAFDVSAPVMEERWDMEEVAAPEARQPVPLAARVASRRADIEARVVPEAIAEEAVADPTAAPPATLATPGTGDAPTNVSTSSTEPERPVTEVVKPNEVVQHHNDSHDRTAYRVASDEPPHPADVAAPGVLAMLYAASGEGARTEPTAPSPDHDDLCASVSPYDQEQTCVRERGHSQKLMCRDQNGQATWPRPEGWK